MPDFAVRTAFSATDKISPAFNRMGNAADKFGARATRNIGIVNRSMTLLRDLMPAVGIAMVGAFTGATITAAREMARLDTSFKSVFGGEAASEIKFVSDEARRLGLVFTSSAAAYKGIAAAAKGTAINNLTVKETFLGVSEAATALQLTGEQTEGALLAISQIISKGKVSMEELRGQLGERIPGAMQIAARAMGVTTAGLEEMVKKGISAEKFIPKFAAQMRKEFGGAAADAATSFNAASNRFDNLTFQMKANLGGLLLPALNILMETVTPIIASISDFVRNNESLIYTFKLIAKSLPWLVGGFLLWKAALIGVATWQAIITAAGWIKYLAEMAPLIMKSVRAQGFFTTMLKGTALWETILAVRTKALAAAQWLLNLAMDANPIGLVIIGIAALIGLVAVAIRYWDKWGAALMIAFGPLGMIIAMVKALYDNWELVKQSFSEGGIISGIKTIGAVVLSGLLYPVQQLLELISNIPGIGGYAGSAAASVKGFREGLVAPNQSAVAANNNNVNVNISNRNVESKASVTPKYGAVITGNLGLSGAMP